MRPPEELETERLVLRRARSDDAQALFNAYASDPQATRYLSWRTHESVAQTKEFLDDAEASWDHGSEFAWVVIPREGLRGPRSDEPRARAAPPDGARPIGALGAVPGAHGVEIGYVLGRDWWGQHLMVEAVAAVMDWFQRQPAVYRIWAYCEASHLRSVRVLERSGMNYEGTLKRWIMLPNLADEPCDAKVFAWTRPG